MWGRGGTCVREGRWPVGRTATSARELARRPTTLRRMVHLRVVAPPEQARAALELLEQNTAACHLIHLPGAARRPDGDMILFDLPREEASVVIGDLEALRIHEVGAISVEPIDVQLSERADAAEREAPGAPADAVVWEQVEARTS